KIWLAGMRFTAQTTSLNPLPIADHPDNGARSACVHIAMLLAATGGEAPTAEKNPPTTNSVVPGAPGLVAIELTQPFMPPPNGAMFNPSQTQMLSATPVDV